MLVGRTNGLSSANDIENMASATSIRRWIWGLQGFPIAFASVTFYKVGRGAGIVYYTIERENWRFAIFMSRLAHLPLYKIASPICPSNDLDPNSTGF